MVNPIFKEILSANEQAANFAGNYMYMHSEQDGSDHFKHIDTRKYIVVKEGLPWTKN